jgi:hypothetical protein
VVGSKKGPTSSTFLDHCCLNALRLLTFRSAVGVLLILFLLLPLVARIRAE